MADKASIMRALRMAMGESGKTISDLDRQRAMDRAGMLQALEAGETGSGMSDADLRKLQQLMGRRGMRRPNATSPRPRLRPGTMQDVSPSAEKGDIMLMLQEMQNRRRKMNPLEMKKGGAVKKKRTKKPKNGCTMKGRGGKYKGMK